MPPIYIICLDGLQSPALIVTSNKTQLGAPLAPWFDNVVSPPPSPF